MAPPYRVIFADLIPPAGTSGIREEIMIHDLKYGFALNTPGSFSGYVNLDDPKCTRANLNPGATAIYIERGGLLVWGGILWTAKADTITRRLDLGGEGFWSYFRRRLIRNRTGMTHSATGNVDTFFPTGDGNKTSNINAGPGGTNFWANVAHKIWNPVQAIFNTDAGNMFEYQANFSGIQSGQYQGLSIVGLRVNVVGQAFPANGKIFPAVHVGGTTYTGGSSWQLQPTQSTISFLFSTNPATGVAWTGSDIEAFASSSSAGFKVSDAPTALSTFVNNIWIEVIWGANQTPVFLTTDELAIVQDLINNAQLQPGGSIGVTVGTELTTDNGGVQQVRDRTYHTFDRTNVGQAVEDLAALLNGFDFSIEVAWDATGTIPQRSFHLYYPRRGRRIDGLVFNHNIAGTSKFQVSVDATKQANLIDAIGQGSGDAMLIASAADTSMAAVYPLLEGVTSHKDVADQSTLVAHAQADLGRAKLPLELPSISKKGDVWPDFGSFQIGDEGLVVASDSWVNYSAFQRIQTIDVNVSDEGFEMMDIGLVSADASVN